MFSTATQTIEAAIYGSTISLGTVTQPEAPKASVTVWASVKADIRQISGRSRVDFGTGLATIQLAGEQFINPLLSQHHGP